MDDEWDDMKEENGVQYVEVEWDTPPSSPKIACDLSTPKKEQKQELVDLAIALQKALAIATPQEIKTVVAIIRRRQRTSL